MRKKPERRCGKKCGAPLAGALAHILTHLQMTKSCVTMTGMNGVEGNCKMVATKKPAKQPINKDHRDGYLLGFKHGHAHAVKQMTKPKKAK